MRRRRDGVGSVQVALVVWSFVSTLGSEASRPGVDPFFRPLPAGEDGEEGLREHGQGDVSIPCVVEADLIVVEPNAPFSRLETLLDGIYAERHPAE